MVDSHTNDYTISSELRQEANKKSNEGFELPNASQTPEKEMNASDYMVAFSGQTKSFCVGMVDMSGSTKMSVSLHRTKIMKYYEIFLNTLSRILSKYDASVIKNGGDSLLYYFPKTVRHDKQYGFMGSVECGLALLDARDDVNIQMTRAGLSDVDYKVSSDYGQVILMKSNQSNTMDMVGAAMNVCAKINSKAPPNEMVIGKDMYKKTKDFTDYEFEEMKGYDIDIGYDYPTYSVLRRA